MDNKLITVKEIAEVLNIKPGTMQTRWWQKRYGCPLFRIGKGKKLYAYRTAFWKWIEKEEVMVRT